ncbi:hypothetical protein DID88_009525 [Monilinia fructigena]|uniref:Amino acid permease/ SLC12A domain-containing protein n=1 Tax=Monilinia fructigena TaxID=38457 RepID=A0A395IMM2_9HELO|nr:hypothetical protein DID88_009525 [Monilinia fructigena]
MAADSELSIGRHPSRASRVEQHDEEELAEFGYKQELRRDWSVITGITTLFSYGLITGGPGVMSKFSAIPTAGGPYYWAALLAPRNHSAFASWITGWFNFLGQVAVTTGISFGLAGLISTTAAIKSSYVPSSSRTIAIAVLAKAPTHQSARFVFAKFHDGTGVDPSPGWSIRASPAYVACCGVLMAQYTLTGFDASAHLSEETRNASWSAPIGVISSRWWDSRILPQS